ncbi:UBP-type zinc finger domain-containing protein [Streptomyces sp. FB2]|uniref:UBP-type zinc finger domain-containing protein n=1 Tax=Streptomyces sp. FB2 TaxID=2902454 RepID=UPI001F211841|nr:UBP-type zinc finger domain-containing protein [Streptomyces sp. FB2]MCF2536202.1 UBP-type zinc finger domain-containing protein [Streptomyces sp. FB2]
MTVRTDPHLALVRPVQPRTAEGCEECLLLGSPWVHLRLCLTCGHVGCCDSSPNKHARRHAAADGHPIVSSLEPGEDWRWCFVHEAFV